MKLTNYQPPKQELWQGRVTSHNAEYLYQVVKFCNVEDLKQEFRPTKNTKIALIGFCCDAGIARNQGRIGAKQGPDAIRTQLAKLAWHFGSLEFFDFGDIVCNDDNLEHAQESLSLLIAFALNQGFLPIVLGGGHETAWGHYQGIRMAAPKKNISIINFDAHFDLREIINGKGTSGTSFLQIAENAKFSHLAFNYLVLGIQPANNTQLLFETAKSLGVNYLLAEDIFTFLIEQKILQIKKFLENSDGIYLTFCLDVMSEAIAPGVSAPQANGLFPQHVWPILQYILQQKKLLSFDIVECAPNLDTNQQTARFASRVVYEVMRGVA